MKREEAIEIARKLYNESLFLKKDKEAMATLIPELKESGDERIRKALLNEFIHLQSKGYKFAGLEGEEIIAWLEKQGHDGKKWIYEDVYIKEKEQLIQDGIDEVLENPQKYGLEKQGEKKHIIEMKSAEESLGIDSDTYNEIVDECIYGDADKIEPKFKVGDWLQYRNAKPFFVEEITKQGYISGDSCLLFNWENEIHLWTIKDAKIGDVLVASDDSIFLFAGVIDCACMYYAALLTANTDVEISKGAESSCWETSTAVHPATKKEHDLLFRKIKEAGYTFDFDKKELKKIAEACLE